MNWEAVRKRVKTTASYILYKASQSQTTCCKVSKLGSAHHYSLAALQQGQANMLEHVHIAHIAVALKDKKLIRRWDTERDVFTTTSYTYYTKYKKGMSSLRAAR